MMLNRFSNNVNFIIERICMFLIIIVQYVVFSNVFFRYVINKPIFYAEEFVIIIISWCTFLGYSVVVLKRRQMKMLIINRILTGNKLKIVNNIVALLSISFLIILFWSSIELI